MIRYFPIENSRFETTMNARAYAGPLIEIDPLSYAAETALRSEIIESDRSYYHSCIQELEPLAWEATELLIRELAASYPQWFIFDGKSWTNLLKNESYSLRIGCASSLPYGDSPLDWIGRQVQEDLILMKSDGSGEAVCVGGHLCFAAGWSLPDKMGRRFLQIHKDVPGFIEQIGAPSDLLMRRLKPGRPVMRFNWTLAESNALNRAPKLRHSWLDNGRHVTAKNAGERVFFRVEKQTLTRLTKTGGVLFTIRTFVNSIAEVASDPNRLSLLRAAVKDMPSETVQYKNAALYYDALVQYLESLG